MNKHLVLLTGGAIVLLDQAIKQMLLRTAYVFNTTIFSVRAELSGGVMSLWFSIDSEFVTLLFSIAVILLFGVVVWYGHGFPLALILAGGISNIVDRIIYGQVVDVLHVGLLSTNGADVAIVAGVLYVLVSVVWYTDR